MGTVRAAGDDFPTQELAFVDGLIKRAIFSGNQLDAIAQQRRRVEARAKADTLYLAVLGEFSSGKSTFINALLRTPLLKSAHQATTAAATFIRFGEEFSLTVDFVDGTRSSATGGNCRELSTKLSQVVSTQLERISIQDLLDLVTVEPSVTAHVRQVEIAMPAKTLGSRLCIIDTPGIGAGADYARPHEAVTERVTAEIADVAVVLIPAGNAMTKTLTVFLQERAARFLHRCVFVITKMDQIEEVDRITVRDVVARRLARILGTEPPILEAAAATMLPVRQLPPRLRDAWTYWQGNFRTMEESLDQQLSRNRTVVIAEHLTILLHSLLTELESTIGNRRAFLAQEQLTLEQHSVVELERVLKPLLERCSAEIEEEVASCLSHTRTDAAVFASSAKQAATEVLQRATKSSLVGVLRTEVPAAVNRSLTEFDRRSQLQLQGLRRRCQSVQRLFTEQFEKSYRNLQALGLKIELSPGRPISSAVGKGQFAESQRFLEASERTRATIGAITGTAVGCFTGMFFGVAGLFVGALIGAVASGSLGGVLMGAFLGAIGGFGLSVAGGGLVGARFGSNMGSLTRQREAVAARLLPEIDAHVTKIVAARLQDFETARTTALLKLNELIEAHKVQYSEAVNRMLQEHQRKVSRLIAEEQQVEIDSAELRERSQRLEERRQRLRSA